MAPILVGKAATAATAATAGIIGTGGAITGAGLATGAALGLGITAAVMGSRTGGGFKAGAVERAGVTAEPVAQLSEQARRNRRLAASTLTREFAEPRLGIPALLG